MYHNKYIIDPYEINTYPFKCKFKPEQNIDRGFFKFVVNTINTLMAAGHAIHLQTIH